MLLLVITIVAGGLAIFVLLLGSTTIVSTRNVGIMTTFGRPSGTLPKTSATTSSPVS